MSKYIGFPIRRDRCREGEGSGCNFTKRVIIIELPPSTYPRRRVGREIREIREVRGKFATVATLPTLPTLPTFSTFITAIT